MARLLILLLNLYAWVIIARALISWFNPNPRSPLVRLLHQATEPVLRPLRQVLSPSGMGGIDISPIVAIVLIQVAKYVVITLAFR